MFLQKQCNIAVIQECLLKDKAEVIEGNLKKPKTVFSYNFLIKFNYNFFLI